LAPGESICTAAIGPISMLRPNCFKGLLGTVICRVSESSGLTSFPPGVLKRAVTADRLIIDPHDAIAGHKSAGVGRRGLRIAWKNVLLVDDSQVACAEDADPWRTR